MKTFVLSPPPSCLPGQLLSVRIYYEITGLNVIYTMFGQIPWVAFLIALRAFFLTLAKEYFCLLYGSMSKVESKANGMKSQAQPPKNQ